MRGLWSLSCLVLIFLMNACKDEETTQTNPPISEIPEITFLNISESSIQQFDSLIFTISYIDGDGDLGFQSADSMSLFVTDNRFPVTHGYHIPPLSPSGTSVTIQGVLEIVLENVILKDSNAGSELATFTIRLKDGAGNWSNGVNSPDVTITP